MKRILSFVATVAGGLVLAAQTPLSVPVNNYMESNPVSRTPVFTPVIGIGGSTFLESSSDDDSGTSGGFAVTAGVGIEFPFTASWSLHTGLNFVSLMSHSNGIVHLDAAPGRSIDTFEESIHQNYLQLPVMAGLRLHLTGNLHLSLRLGAYVACGVGGNTTITRGQHMKESYGTFSGNAFNRFDAGPVWGISFEYHRFTVGYSGFVGLVDRSSYLDANNFANFFTLGYRI